MKHLRTIRPIAQQRSLTCLPESRPHERTVHSNGWQRSRFILKDHHFSTGRLRMRPLEDLLGSGYGTA